MIAVVGLAGVAVLSAPGLILAAAARKGGVPGSGGADLVVVGAAVGVLHLAVLLRGRPAPTAGAVDHALAGLLAIAVLAIASTAVVLAVLGGLPLVGVPLVGRGWGVTAGWAVALLAGAWLADRTRRAALRWLAVRP